MGGLATMTVGVGGGVARGETRSKTERPAWGAATAGGWGTGPGPGEGPRAGDEKEQQEATEIMVYLRPEGLRNPVSIGWRRPRSSR